MSILTRFIGALAGLIFALLVSFALLSLLSGGDPFFLALLLIPIGGASVVAGAITGAVLGPKAVHYLAAKAQSHSERAKKRLLTLAFVLSIPVLVIFSVWFWRQANEPPSDAAMLKHFARHETTFTMLLGMASADKELTRVDQNWTLPADSRSVGVSPERLATYRALLADAGTPRLSAHPRELVPVL
jgi:hypothetical protein